MRWSGFDVISDFIFSDTALYLKSTDNWIAATLISKSSNQQSADLSVCYSSCFSVLLSVGSITVRKCQTFHLQCLHTVAQNILFLSTSLMRLIKEVFLWGKRARETEMRDGNRGRCLDMAWQNPREITVIYYWPNRSAVMIISQPEES